MTYLTGKRKLRDAIRALKLQIAWDVWTDEEIEAHEEAIRTFRASLRAMTADSRRK